MKSGVSLIELTKILSRYCIVGLLLLTYLVNLSPEGSLPSHTDSAEKTIVVFDQADPDFSSDYEIDLIDDTVIKPLCTDVFQGFLSNVTKECPLKSQTFSAVHLEILIPPPRLNS